MTPGLTALIFAALSLITAACHYRLERRAQLDSTVQVLLGWEPTAKRALIIQVLLAAIGGITGVAASRDGNWLWAAGGFILIFNYAYAIKGLARPLLSTGWKRLHIIRIGIATAATIILGAAWAS